MDTTYTRETATAYVENALTNGGRNPETLEDFDVPAIVDAIYDAGGSWDVSGLGTGTFWGICERHAR